MTDTLLDTSPAAGAPEGIPENYDDHTAPETPMATDTPMEGAPGRPSGLPDKFWDTECGEVQSDSLIKSYQPLQQKLGTLSGGGVPENSDGYDIKSENEMFANDPDVNAKLHTLGFSQEQAQTVYDLAAEYMSPMVSDVAAEFHA